MNPTVETMEHAQHVLNYITAFPERHEQDSWFYNKDGFVTEGNLCGTVMCVAGTSVFLKEGPEALGHGIGFERKAGANLGLESRESSQLFYTMNKSKAKAMLDAVAQGDERLFQTIYEDENDEYEDE